VPAVFIIPFGTETNHLGRHQALSKEIMLWPSINSSEETTEPLPTLLNGAGMDMITQSYNDYLFPSKVGFLFLMQALGSCRDRKRRWRLNVYVPYFLGFSTKLRSRVNVSMYKSRAP